MVGFISQRPTRVGMFTASLAVILGAGLAAATARAASVPVTSFDVAFTAMTGLKSVAAAGKGKIGVLLPETTTSARYNSFDTPYLKKAFAAAGLPASDVIITNAQGSESTQLTQAQADIAQGATVLLVDPISSGVGASVESYAKSHGVKVIDYDRLTLGGSRDYYVSFNNVAVGHLIGEGMVACLSAWHVAKPNILVTRGAPTDNNATLFAQGYDAVLAPYFASGKYVKAGEPAGTWDPATAQTTFQEQLTAHPAINAAVIPNDDNANAIVAYLKTMKVPPRRFPTTGQDATLTGLRNILAVYQCGSAYKPIYLEAQAAASLALYLRAGQTPPEGLVNGTTMDSEAKVAVPSSLLTPIWVTPANMNATVVKDAFVSPKALCASGLDGACKAAGITP